LLEDGRVLVTGGGDGQRAVTSAELYDPVTGQWSQTGSMATRRSLHSATLLADGRVLVVGGADDPNIFSSAGSHDPASGSWSPVASMSGPRAEHTAVLLPNGMVMVIGGTSNRQTNTQLASIEVYDPAADKWYPGASLTAPRRGQATSPLGNGLVLATGGF